MNIDTHRVLPDVRVQIECAIARGRTLDWMLEHLHVSTRDVDATLAHLDDCNSEIDNEPLPCGTHAAYNRHRAAHEPIDAACKAGEAEYQAAQYAHRGVGQRRVIEPCGTHAAFNRHRKRGEPVDEACLFAERKYQAERSSRRRQQQRAVAA